MKPNQTSVTNNVQNILIPMEIFNCTQGDNEGNHRGIFAVDLAGKDTGMDFAYFPFDAKCVAVDTAPGNGNAVWWQSVNKVRFADGTIDYCTLMVIHDNNLAGIRVGVSYKQGQQMAQEGTAGWATGNHLHIEFAKGVFTKQYALNQFGYYHLPNSIPIEKVCFKDGTTFKVALQANWGWKDASSIPAKPNPAPTPVGLVPQRGTFIPTTAMKVRRQPSVMGEHVATYPAGSRIAYDGYIRINGFTWISYVGDSGKRNYVAAREGMSANSPAYGKFE